MASDPADIAGGGGTRREGSPSDPALIAGGAVRGDPAEIAGRQGTTFAPVSQSAQPVVGLGKAGNTYEEAIKTGKTPEEARIADLATIGWIGDPYGGGRPAAGQSATQAENIAALNRSRGIFVSAEAPAKPIFAPQPQAVQESKPTTLREIREDAKLADQKYIALSVGLPLATVQANWESGANFSSKIGKYSYSSLTEAGISSAEKTGKGFSPISGDITMSGGTSITPYSRQPISLVPKMNLETFTIPKGAIITNAQSLVKGGESIKSSLLTLFPKGENTWKGVPYKAIGPEMKEVNFKQPFSGYIDFSEGATTSKSSPILAAAMGAQQENYTTMRGVVLSESETTPNKAFLTASGMIAENIKTREIGVAGKFGERGTYQVSDSASIAPILAPKIAAKAFTAEELLSATQNARERSIANLPKSSYSEFKGQAEGISGFFDKVAETKVPTLLPNIFISEKGREAGIKIIGSQVSGAYRSIGGVSSLISQQDRLSSLKGAVFNPSDTRNPLYAKRAGMETREASTDVAITAGSIALFEGVGAKLNIISPMKGIPKGGVGQFDLAPSPNVKVIMGEPLGAGGIVRETGIQRTTMATKNVGSGVMVEMKYQQGLFSSTEKSIIPRAYTDVQYSRIEKGLMPKAQYSYSTSITTPYGVKVGAKNIFGEMPKTPLVLGETITSQTATTVKLQPFESSISLGKGGVEPIGKSKLVSNVQTFLEGKQISGRTTIETRYTGLATGVKAGTSKVFEIPTYRQTSTGNFELLPNKGGKVITGYPSAIPSGKVIIGEATKTSTFIQSKPDFMGLSSVSGTKVPTSKGLIVDVSGNRFVYPERISIGEGTIGGFRVGGRLGTAPMDVVVLSERPPIPKTIPKIEGVPAISFSEGKFTPRTRNAEFLGAEAIPAPKAIGERALTFKEMGGTSVKMPSGQVQITKMRETPLIKQAESNPLSAMQYSERGKLAYHGPVESGRVGGFVIPKQSTPERTINTQRGRQINMGGVAAIQLSQASSLQASSQKSLQSTFNQFVSKAPSSTIFQPTGVRSMQAIKPLQISNVLAPTISAAVSPNRPASPPFQPFVNIPRPYNPPQPPPPEPPKLPPFNDEGGGGLGKLFRMKKLKGRKLGYSPSIISSEGFVRITGKLSKAITSGKQSLSGLEIRPIQSNRGSNKAFRGVSSSKSMKMPKMGKVPKIKGLSSSGFKMPRMKGIIGKRRKFI